MNQEHIIDAQATWGREYIKQMQILKHRTEQGGSSVVLWPHRGRIYIDPWLTRRLDFDWSRCHSCSQLWNHVKIRYDRVAECFYTTHTEQPQQSYDVQFRYLADMLCVDGDANAAEENRIKTGWNKFRQLVPLLTNKDISVKVRGRLYSSCVEVVCCMEVRPGP